MPWADFSVATPTPQQVAAYGVQTANDVASAKNAVTDAGANTSRNTLNYMHRTLPQLNSSLGATGQWYSGAAQGAQKNGKWSQPDQSGEQQFGAIANSASDLYNANADVNTAMNRHNDELTRQQAFAAIGLIV